MADSGKGTAVRSVPDSLQNLCIFYCMNNLNVIVASLNRLALTEERSATLSQLLGNQMLEYFMRCGIPSKDQQPFLDQLLQNDQLCNELILRRSGLLTYENICELSNNHLKCIELTCSLADNDKSKCMLVQKNKEHLTKLSISQRGGEELAIALLSELLGQDTTSDTNGSQHTDNSENKHSDFVANTKFVSFGGCTVVPMETRPSQSEPEIKQKAKKLKSFMFQQVLSDRSFGRNSPSYESATIYSLLLEILKQNQEIVSFSMFSVISHPAQWLLSQREIHSLQNLQSLTLSFVNRYCQEVVRTEGNLDFFTSLPSLRCLRLVPFYCLIQV